MKNKIIITIVVLGFFLVGFGFLATSQMPPPPPPGGQDDNQPVATGNGLALLSILGLGFGAKKLYEAHKKHKFYKQK